MAEAILRTIPGKVGVIPRCLFDLARHIKALETQRGSMFEWEERAVTVTAWMQASNGVLDPTVPPIWYLGQLDLCYRAVEYPSGSAVLAVARQLALTNPFPEEANQFRNAQQRLLVAVCWHLQAMAGTKPFFISCRGAMGVLEGVTFMTTARWLRILRSPPHQILTLTKHSDGYRANRYRYNHFKP